MSFRQFLKGLELDGDAIDTIMAEHGRLTTKNLERITELEGKLKDNPVDPKTQKELDDLKIERDALQAKYDKEVGELQGEIENTKLDHYVSQALTKSGAIDAVSVKAHLSDFLKSAKFDKEKKSVEGLDAAIEGIKTSQKHLFGEDGAGGQKQNKTTKVADDKPVTLSGALAENYE